MCFEHFVVENSAKSILPLRQQSGWDGRGGVSLFYAQPTIGSLSLNQQKCPSAKSPDGVIKDEALQIEGWVLLWFPLRQHPDVVLGDPTDPIICPVGLLCFVWKIRTAPRFAQIFQLLKGPTGWRWRGLAEKDLAGSLALLVLSEHAATIA